jgi:hypothetical protein
LILYLDSEPDEHLLQQAALNIQIAKRAAMIVPITLHERGTENVPITILHPIKRRSRCKRASKEKIIPETIKGAR